MKNIALFLFSMMNQVQSGITPDAVDPLKDLKDIHLPPAPSIWPLAWGWWVLGAFIVVLVLAIFYGWRNYKKATRYRLLARRDLELIVARINRGETENGLQELLLLIKRTAIAGGFDVQVFVGKRWIEWLRNSTSTPCFSAASLELIETGMYRKPSDQDLAQLITEISIWIQKHQKISPITRRAIFKGASHV